MSTPPPNQPPQWGQQPGPGWGQQQTPAPYTPGWGQPPTPPKKGGAGKKVGIGCLGAVGLIIVIGVAGSMASKSTTSPSSTAAAPATQASKAADNPAPAAPATSAPAAAPPATSAPAATQHTVTFIVTGSKSADVQYGSAGSNSQGHAPMKVTQPLGNPLYYSISAQLQGDGQVGCELQVDGKTVATGSANGGYNIAMCEISKDPLSGQWKDTNQG